MSNPELICKLSSVAYEFNDKTYKHCVSKYVELLWVYQQWIEDMQTNISSLYIDL
jgi:hypothetical protein